MIKPIKIISLLFLSLLMVSCKVPITKHGNILTDGVYESFEGYTIQLDQDVYNLCHSGECQAGELYRGKNGKSVYLIDFRNKIPKSDTDFPIWIKDFVNAKGPDHWQRDLKPGEIAQDDDVYIYTSAFNLHHAKFPNAQKRHCNKHPCFILGAPGHGTKYLFTYKTDYR